MKRVTCFKTEDGKLFESAEEAILHERKQEFETKLYKLIEEKVKDEELQEMVDCISGYSINKYDMYKPPFIDYVRRIIMDNIKDFTELFREITDGTE